MRGIYKLTHTATGNYFIFLFNGKGSLRARVQIILDQARRGLMNERMNALAQGDNTEWTYSVIENYAAGNLFILKQEHIKQAVAKDGDKVLNHAAQALVRAA